MAFLRIVKAEGGKGIQHEYVRLVEGYSANGKDKQRGDGARASGSGHDSGICRGQQS